MEQSKTPSKRPGTPFQLEKVFNMVRGIKTKKLKSTVVICLLLLSLVPTQSIRAQELSSTAESRKLNKMFEDYYEEHLRLFPLTATAIAQSKRELLKSNFRRFFDQLKQINHRTFSIVFSNLSQTSSICASVMRLKKGKAMTRSAARSAIGKSPA